ncbi:MAG: hypothetical protein SPD80_04290 [Atopobium sp.]|nr:hypothetical protein [Atopobium sp.]
MSRQKTQSERDNQQAYCSFPELAACNIAAYIKQRQPSTPVNDCQYKQVAQLWNATTKPMA